jgi:acyl-CoA synthetase (AMP-forming)/AMP-acid ligase II
MRSAQVIGDVVADNAGRWPDKVALVSAGGAATTFTAFAERVRRLTAALRRFGLAPGARVAILSRNRPEYLEAVCAASQRHIAVPLNWRLAPHELAVILADCEPALLFADAEFAPRVDELRAMLGFVPLCVCFDGARRGLPAYEDVLADATSEAEVGSGPQRTPPASSTRAAPPADRKGPS